MPINKTRLAEFRRELAALQNALSFDEHYRVIKAKFLDALARGQFQDMSQRQAERFIDTFFKPEHAKFVKKIFSTFNDVLDLLNTLYQDLGVEVKRDFTKIRAIEAINRTRLGDYEEKSVQAIARAIRQGIAHGDNFRKITRRLIGIDEKVTMYADTIARTQVKGYARTAKAEKARLGEVFFYEYVGIIRRTTRPFCLALIGTAHHIDRIQKMRNGNLNPVLQYCGGWNCHHDWEPDPFATKQTEAEEQISGKIIIFTPKNFGELERDYKQTLRGMQQKKN